MSAAVCKAGIANCKCTLQLDLGDGVYLCLIKIPAGEFMMGSRGYEPDEEPMHRVVIAEDFYLATTPVTQKQARVLMQGAGIEHKNHFKGHDQRPAENLSADDADKCCAWLHQSLGRQQDPSLQKNKLQVRLPSEAEWEYACQLGSADSLEYHNGDGAAALAQAGWFDHTAEYGDQKGNAHSRTHDVAALQPNAAGLYDMHGNVWEWCIDGWDGEAYRKRPDGVVNPLIPRTGNADRVVRGGSWDFPAFDCRAASRYSSPADYRDGLLGFRVGLFPVHSCQSKQPNNQQAG